MRTSYASILIDGKEIGTIDVTLHDGHIAIPPGSVVFGHKPPEESSDDEAEPTFRKGIGPGSPTRRRPGTTFRHGVHSDAEPSDAKKAEPSAREKMRLADIQSAVRGGVIRPYKPAPGADEREELRGLKGSKYLETERAWIKRELDADPGLKRYLAGVLTHEEPAGQRVKAAESLFNRLNLLKQSHPGITLKDYLAGKYGQFYGPITRGEINERWLREQVDPYDQKYDEINRALAGSNTVEGFTDQGTLKGLHGRPDPNAVEESHGPHVQVGNEIYGEILPGARAYRERQQAAVRGEGPRDDQPAAGPSESRGISRRGPEPDIPDEQVGGVKPEFPVAPGVNVSRMKPEMIARLNAAYRAAPEKFTVISGYRPATRAEARALGMSESSSQEDIWHRHITTGSPSAAAPPGLSRHQKGEAADVGGPGREWLAEHLGEFGLEHAKPSNPNFDRYHTQLKRDDTRSRIAKDAGRDSDQGTVKVTPKPPTQTAGGTPVPPILQPQVKPSDKQ